MTKELLFSITKKDFIVETFRSGGRGDQHQNKKKAFRQLLEHPKWKSWFKIKCSQMLIFNNYEKYILGRVEKMLEPQNLKVKTFENGKWIEIENDFVSDGIKDGLIEEIREKTNFKFGKMDIKKTLAENNNDVGETIKKLNEKSPIIKYTKNEE